MSDDAIKRYLNRPPPEPPASDAGAEPSVAPTWIGACLRLAGDAATPSLVFRQRDGKIVALSYTYLTGVWSEPSGEIRLDFVNYTVSIRGRRLTAVLNALAMHRAFELVESKSEFEEDTETPFIESIGIVATEPR